MALQHNDAQITLYYDQATVLNITSETSSYELTSSDMLALLAWLNNSDVDAKSTQSLWSRSIYR